MGALHITDAPDRMGMMVCQWVFRMKSLYSGKRMY